MTETSPVGDLLAPAEERRARRRLLGRPRPAGPPLPWVELRLVDDDGGEVAVGRGVDRRDRGARAVDRRRATTATSSGRREVRRRLAAHRRHRGGRRARLRPDHRPHQGRDQVRRRVDLLGRARERADGPPRRDRGGGDRQARRALGRAPALLRGAARGGADRAPRSSSSTCAARVAKWWLPDEFAFIEEVPKTSVGKFDKKVLRGALAEGTLEGRVRVGA